MGTAYGKRMALVPATQAFSPFVVHLYGGTSAKKFPQNKFSEIYEGSVYPYNFVKLRERLLIDCGLEISRDTLQKILGGDIGVDFNKINSLFTALGEVLGENGCIHASRDDKSKAGSEEDDLDKLVQQVR